MRQGRRRFKAISSTTTAQTSTPTQSGRPGCEKTQPKLLVIWGKHDLSFDPSEPERYSKDVPSAEVYVLDAGHFALDTKADEIAALVRSFMEARKR